MFFILYIAASPRKPRYFFAAKHYTYDYYTYDYIICTHNENNIKSPPISRLTRHSPSKSLARSANIDCHLWQISTAQRAAYRLCLWRKYRAHFVRIFQLSTALLAQKPQSACEKAPLSRKRGTKVPFLFCRKHLVILITSA